MLFYLQSLNSFDFRKLHLQLYRQKVGFAIFWKLHFLLIFLQSNAMLCLKDMVEHYTSEILPCRQFHQHFRRMFFIQNFGAKHHKAELIREKFQNLLSNKKCARKMLIKLIPRLEVLLLI